MAGETDKISLKSNKKFPKKKYALVFGYLGTNYHGMQKQISNELKDDLPTIEGELENCLFKSGAITEMGIKEHNKLRWSRVGRTDKGVHAACQVVCAKLSLGLQTEQEKNQFVSDNSSTDQKDFSLLVERRRQNLIENISKLLPNSFVLYDIIRVCNSYDARLRALKRQYEYVIPGIFLSPFYLKNNEDVIHHFLNEFNINSDEKIKPVPFDQKKKLWDYIKNSDCKLENLFQGSYADILIAWRKENDLLRQNYSRLTIKEKIEYKRTISTEDEYDKNNLNFSMIELNSLQQKHNNSYHVVSDEELNRFQAILKDLEGNHHWYNFTSRLKPDDKSGLRNISSVKCYRMGHDDELGSLLVVRLVGQSFLLNQIRKMLAAAIEIYNYTAPTQSIKYLYQSPLDPKKNIHLVPGEGLLLERAYFNTFNYQQNINYEGLVLHDDYELQNAYTIKLLEYMSTGVMKKKIINEFIDEDQAEEVEIIADWYERNSTPNWLKITQFKFNTIFPHIINIYKTTDCIQKFLNEVALRPFFLENFPTPSKSVS